MCCFAALRGGGYLLIFGSHLLFFILYCLMLCQVFLDMNSISVHPSRAVTFATSLAHFPVRPADARTLCCSWGCAPTAASAAAAAAAGGRVSPAAAAAAAAGARACYPRPHPQQQRGVPLPSESGSHTRESGPLSLGDSHSRFPRVVAGALGRRPGVCGGGG